MNARELRKQIEAIDRKLNELQPWEKQLVAARRQWLLDTSDDARTALAIIDKGLPPAAGRPAALDLPLFDVGWAGLVGTREKIAELNERRSLLVEQLPSRAETETKIREAEGVSADIRTRADELAARTASAQVALTEAARLALAVAEDTRQLWEDNAVLDKLAHDADIARPDTPRAQAAVFPMALPLSVLLQNYFNGGQPGWLEPNLVRDILAGWRDGQV